MKGRDKSSTNGSNTQNTKSTPPFADTTNTYGAHLLVDFSSIEEADRLLEEGETFLQQANASMFLLPIVSRVTGNMNKNWRLRRKDSKLLSTYQTLYPRVLESEGKLRKILGEVVEKKSALRIQARHLQCRLISCVEHNKTLLEETERPMDDLRDVIDTLSGESSVLKEMIEFNKELLRFGYVEKVSRGQAALGWGDGPRSALYHNMNRYSPEAQVLSEHDLMNDDLHPDIETRLIVMRKLREKFVHGLQGLLEIRGGHLVNLQQCERSLEVIAGILNRSGVSVSSTAVKASSPGKSTVDGTSSGSSSGSTSVSADDMLTEAGMTNMTFDHSRCADCSYGCSMTMDCACHLEALQKQGVDANHRLQSLVEMRERIMEEADRITEEMSSTLPATTAPTAATAATSGGGGFFGYSTHSANAKIEESEQEMHNNTHSNRNSTSNGISDSSAVNSNNTSSGGKSPTATVVGEISSV